MLKRILIVTVAAASTLALTIPGSAAAQNGGAMVLKCGDLFGSGVTGVIAITAIDTVNVNCGFPGPSAGGGAVVTQCPPGVTGNIVINPNGPFHERSHCQFL